MKVYTLEREQFLPVDIQQAWAFFSSPANLDTITPPDMGFDVISEVPAHISEGLLIEYRITPLLGIKLKWITRIAVVEPPAKFIDTQLTGPYALWEHTHTFEKRSEGVLMRDKVRYAVPFGILGRLANALIVKNKLEHIFNFRYNKLEELFKK